MITKERFDILIKHFADGNKREFASKVDVAPTVIENIVGKRQSNPSFMVLQKILCAFENINPNWLIAGKGEMLKSEEKEQKNLIPLYDTQTIGGTNGYSADLEPISKPSEWIDAGDLFIKATAAIHHYGDSMTEYPSGCILVLRDISDYQLIIWGKNYVVETDEYRITKRLQRGNTPDTIKAYSTNEETYSDGTLIHEPVDIPRAMIRRIALVLGYVVKEHSSGKIYKVK